MWFLFSLFEMLKPQENPGVWVYGSFLSTLYGGLGRVKYAPRTPKSIRAPENILRSKRFLGKGATCVKGVAVA